jgi:hypothetical protein
MVPGATVMSGSIDMGSLARAGAVRDFVVFATMFTSLWIVGESGTVANYWAR